MRFAFLVVTVLLALAGAGAAKSRPTLPVPPLGAAGRWLVDATGRTVILHGMNDVEKSAPYFPAAAGLGEDDAIFLASQGFNALRLGVDVRGLMPVPGQVEGAYVEHLAETVDAFARHGHFVLLDFHQDGFSPMFNGNGLPDWMAITDGLPNPPDAVFPLYYIQNPAMQRAFEHFWANDPGPGDIGLQDYFFQGVEAVVARFAASPMVFGTELLNEPWPGAVWQPCLEPGCPEIEAALLEPFTARGTATIRAIAPTQLVFTEPFVLFNFGMAPTTLPGVGEGRALSFHSYALSGAGEEAVVRLAAEAAVRDGAPVVETEFGATTDPVVLTRLTGQADGQRMPWMFWAYNENIADDEAAPAGEDNLVSVAALDALVRPYPMAVAGTPLSWGFDPATKVFDLAFTTELPGGSRARKMQTAVFVPARHYPNGYTAKARGGKITSKPCADLLTIRPRARTVTVQVTPGGRGAKRCR